MSKLPTHELEKQLESLTKKLESQTANYRRTTLERFPFLIIGLSTFGFVAVLYSFEKFIDSLPWLADRPFVILLLGLLSLFISGTLFKNFKNFQ